MQTFYYNMCFHQIFMNIDNINDNINIIDNINDNIYDIIINGKIIDKVI